MQNNKVPFHLFQVCDVFHLAKQFCLPFPTSQRTIIMHFDLNHSDIWGGFAKPPL